LLNSHLENHVNPFTLLGVSLSVDGGSQLIGSCLPNAMNENCTKREAEARTQLQPAEAFTRQIIDWQPQRCIPPRDKIQRCKDAESVGHSLMMMTLATGHWPPLLTLFWPPLTLKSGNLQSLQLVFISWPSQTPRESSRVFRTNYC